MWWRRGTVFSLIVISLIVIGLLKQRDKVVICDVGQGNGAMLISGTTQVLIDVGPADGAMLKCLEKYLPLGDKKIEAIIISHGDSDHDGGLEKIRKYYQIEQVFNSDKIARNDIVRFGKYVIEVVWPGEMTGDVNADSVVLKVVHEKQLFWFLGDITSDVEQYLSWRNMWGGSGGVLIVSHHGSKTATTKEILEVLKPGEAIISVGKNNKYGHPDKEVLKRLEEYGIKLRRTDVEGEMVFL